MTEIILAMNGHMTQSYRKFMYCEINDTKHTKTFISRPFGNSLDLRLVGDLYCFFAVFFCPTEHKSIGKKNCFSLKG